MAFTLHGSRNVRALAAIAASALALGGDCGGTDPGSGFCNDNPDTQELRVHVGNPGTVAGITVTVGVHTVSVDADCDIGELPTEVGEFGQVVIDVFDAGTPVTITAQVGGTASAVCTVAAAAFENLPPGAEDGQAFADVTTEPLGVSCLAGFESVSASAGLPPGERSRHPIRN